MSAVLNAPAILADLVRLDSSNPPGLEQGVAIALAELLSGLGFEVSFEPVLGDRANLHASLGASGGGLAFVSHLDTVPAGEGWASNPWEPTVRDERLVGLGSCDPKASFAAFLAATDRLIREGWRPVHGLRLVGLVDEEERQTGARTWVEGARPHDLPAFAIVGEPTSLEVVCAHKGDLYAEVEFRGAAAHSSDPQAGANALYAAAELVSEIECWHADPSLHSEPEHPLTGFATWSVGKAWGGTGISIVPDRAIVQIDRRFNPSDDPERSLGILRRAAERIASQRARIVSELRTLQAAPAMQTDPSLAPVRALLDAASKANGESSPIGWGATCDANALSVAGVPVVVFGPGDLMAAAHQPNESVSLAELETAVEIFVEAIPRIDASIGEQDA